MSSDNPPNFRCLAALLVEVLDGEGPAELAALASVMTAPPAPDDVLDPVLAPLPELLAPVLAKFVEKTMICEPPEAKLSNSPPTVMLEPGCSVCDPTTTPEPEWL